MEYVESVSLAHIARALRGERLAPAVASRIVCDVLSGLHAAHEAVDLRGKAMNIIHRDVSPQNIIVGVDGTSRLIDFGIAKASTRLTPTTNGILKGKFGYMAPEQIRQHVLDRRVDVFAAGVVLHEVLTSTRLFASGNEADALLGVLVREIPDPSSIVSGLPKELDLVVHRALARDRDERFSTAGEFAAALEAACRPVSPREVAALLTGLCGDSLGERRRKLHDAFDRPPEASAIVAGSSQDLVEPAAAHPRPPGPEQATTDHGPRRSRRRALLVAGGLVAVAGALAVAVALARGAHEAESPATVATASPVAAPVTAPSSANAERATPPAVIPPPSASPVAPPRPVTTAKRIPHPPSTSDIHKNNPYLAP
jgi:serine/threonine-protein kinase